MIVTRTSARRAYRHGRHRRNCRAAMTPTRRLLIIELVLREGNAPGFGSADIVTMTMPATQLRERDVRDVVPCCESFHRHGPDQLESV